MAKFDDDDFEQDAQDEVVSDFAAEAKADESEIGESASATQGQTQGNHQDPPNAAGASAGFPGTGADAQRDKDVRLWGMILHLSTLLGYTAVPLAGLIAPVIIWQIKKEEMPELDAHGKVVVNWLITAMIIYVVGFLLCCTGVGALIGVPVLIGVGLVSVVYAIIGGIKANDGKLWPYPGTFEFIK